MKVHSGYRQQRSQILAAVSRSAAPELPKSVKPRTRCLNHRRSYAGSLSGCLSALSLPEVRGADFNSAAVEFARLRQSESEYDIVALPAPESGGCVADSEISNEVIEALSRHSNIDDEAIESCGYLGWLSGVARSA